MLCSHQAFGTKMEHGHSHLRSNPCNVLGNAVDFLNPSSDQVIATSGNPASLNLYQFTIHQDNCASHTDLYNRQQHHRQQPPTANHDLDFVGWSNFENSYMNSSSSSNYFSTPETGSDQLASSSTRGVSRNRHGTDDPRGFHKDKHAVQVTRDYVNDASLLKFSPNSGMQNWDEPCEVGFNMMGATNINAPEYRHGFLPLVEGRQPDITRIQMESPFWRHCNHSHLFQGNQRNYFSPTFQLGFTWVEQLRSNVGVGPMWNNTTIPYFEGSLDFGNMGCHQGFSFGRNAVMFHSPSAHSPHHLQPMQSLQVPNYSHHPRIPVLNNLIHHRIITTSREGIDSVASAPIPLYYRPYLPQALADPSGNQMRILSAQDNAVLEFPGFHGADNFFDQHRYMRLDIDNMSYEELLALQEQIGDVKTGLLEDAILRNLQMRTFSTPALLLNSSSDTTPETGTCIICQVEYAENERIGTLRCGHEFHADCIKQWLLVKNLCPICKTSGLDPDEKEK